MKDRFPPRHMNADGGHLPPIDPNSAFLEVVSRIPTPDEIWRFLLQLRAKRIKNYTYPVHALARSFHADDAECIGRFIDEIFSYTPNELRQQVSFVRCHPGKAGVHLLRDVVKLKDGKLFYRRFICAVHDRGPNIFPVDDVAKLTVRLDLGWAARGGYYFPPDWPQPHSTWPPLLEPHTDPDPQADIPF